MCDIGKELEKAHKDGIYTLAGTLSAICRTEKIVIHVVSDMEMIQDGAKEFDITRNFSESREEMDRVLKYYGDVPVWNLTAGFESEYLRDMKGKHIVCYIKANCHYRDAREGFLREKEDLRKERRKEYRRRRKEGEKNGTG